MTSVCGSHFVADTETLPETIVFGCWPTVHSAVPQENSVAIPATQLWTPNTTNTPVANA